ncbi:unnamed protein product [Trypanosoma congolense IL3000]|uniref:WGS project CAEQ00000000 data, annotated contig 2305 n=1 Tax=Trypanosoma congolense (strain IL3000) TaxID=1068625 RepID=F9WD17_TRYCI|nr:unnamed protein product [Trypanosoma congolense IL3000]
MMDSGSLLEKLSSLKLSQGARVGDKLLRQGGGSAVNVVMGTTVERRVVAGTPSEGEGPLQGLIIGVCAGSNRDNNDRNDRPRTGCIVPATSTADTAPTKGATGKDNSSNVNLLIRSAAAGSSAKASGKQRASPHSGQLPGETRGKTSRDKEASRSTDAAVTEPFSPVVHTHGAERYSDALEKLIKAVPSTSVVSTSNATRRQSHVSEPPMVVLTRPMGGETAQLATLIAGDHSNPKLVDPIDNFKAQKPIIRTAPPCKHRYIIVGDIHGCAEQLEELLLKVDYQQGKDCLIHVGDLVNKGPDSLAVVQLAQKKGAIGVLGNHDFTLLNYIHRVRGKALSHQDEADPVARLASTFPHDCENYIRSLPHILRVPQYNVIVVHAGLNVDCSLEDQNVYEIMHLRRLEHIVDSKQQQQRSEKSRYRAIVKGSKGEAWGELWKGPECVVFGHDARAGLQELPSAYGIDTGCVYGGQLTAVVYGPDSPKGKLVSVPGLPKDANERRGLPPPAADIYEKYGEELERLILRPTPRCTPPLAGYMREPVFLSAPPASPPLLSSGCTTGFSLPAAGTCSPASVSMMCARRSQPHSHEVERETLLALSREKELRAIKTLMSLPAYEAVWLTVLNSNAENHLNTFWIPFITDILEGLLDICEKMSDHDYVEDLLQLVFEACDEVKEVRKTVTPQLQKLLQRSDEGALHLPKATTKMLRLTLTS